MGIIVIDMVVIDMVLISKLAMVHGLGLRGDTSFLLYLFIRIDFDRLKNSLTTQFEHWMTLSEAGI